MKPNQRYAVECAALDLAYAIRCQRVCETMEEKPLLDTLDDLREAFPDVAVHIECLMNELLGEQA